jgi:imidazolonepropionase-like amidohydrolase
MEVPGMSERESGETFVLRSVNVLDESGGFEGPLDVSVEAGVVTEVGANLHLDSAPSLDGADLWLLPGVFDCHLHVAISSMDVLRSLRTPISQWALQAGANARATLEAGVTFIRDAGGADAGIRAAIDSGLVPGPRSQISVMMLSQTGGHADGFLAGPGLELSSGYVFPDYPGRPPYLVDGVDGMRRTVREILRAGADWIKLCVTGGVMSPTDLPEGAELTLEEIETAVFEARRKGKPVFAHANGGEGIDNALAAGVRSIEHGLFLTEAQAARMAAQGCFFVPTLAIVRDLMRLADGGTLPPYATQKLAELRPRIGDAVRIAREAGVRIALGSDFIDVSQHGRNLEEILLVHEAGLSVEEALRAATRTGAELCGVGDRLGRIAPGYLFDAILLDEEPGDLSLFDRRGSVSGVFKGGRPVVTHPRFAGAELVTA